MTLKRTESLSFDTPMAQGLAALDSADLLDGTELKGIAETTQANSQSISGIHSRVDALDAKVGELISLVGGLQTTVGHSMDSLNGRIESVHADVKNPIIVKRLW